MSWSRPGDFIRAGRGAEIKYGALSFKTFFPEPTRLHHVW